MRSSSSATTSGTPPAPKSHTPGPWASRSTSPTPRSTPTSVTATPPPWRRDHEQQQRIHRDQPGRHLGVRRVRGVRRRLVRQRRRPRTSRREQPALPARRARLRGGVMLQRVQRKRTKGWKAPEGAVYVGRGTPFGNPWAVTRTTIGTGWAVQWAGHANQQLPQGLKDWVPANDQRVAHALAVELYETWVHAHTTLMDRI